MNLYDTAKKITASGGVAGRQRVPMDDLLIAYPKGVTVNGFAKLSSQFGDDYFAFTFDDKYYFTETTGLRKIADAWMAEASAEEIDAELKIHPLIFVLEKTQTQKGKTFIKVEVQRP